MVGDKNVAPHVATKFGLNGLTLALAQDLKDHRIRVNAVCPGAVERDPKKSAALMKEWPSSRPLLADEVADVVVFLASSAARAVNVALFTVYGMTMPSVRTILPDRGFSAKGLATTIFRWLPRPRRNPSSTSTSLEPCSSTKATI
jgi:short-subunit dehydrogenase